MLRLLRWFLRRLGIGRVARRSRAEIRQLLVKLQEGPSLEQVVDAQGRVSFLYGGQTLTAFDGLLGPSRLLRQSFPDYVAAMRARRGQTSLGPNALVPHSLDLFLRMTLLDPRDDADALLRDLAGIPEVEFARVVARASDQPPSAENFAHPITGKQGYLYRDGGVDAEYAWGVRSESAADSGRGKGVRVLVVDQDFCTAHFNLPAVEEPVWGAASEFLDFTEQRHGAKTLGVLGAKHAAGDGSRGGTIGLCPDAKFHFTRAQETDPSIDFDADKSPDYHAALEEALAAVETSGYDFTIVLLELQLDMPDAWMSDHTSFHLLDATGTPVKGIGWVPYEVNRDVLTIMANASIHRGITFVEPAGNTGGELGPIYPVAEWSLPPAERSIIWDPDTDRSGAIMVGAGSAAGARVDGVAFGARLDCQARGDGIPAPVCPAGEECAEELAGTGALTSTELSNEYSLAFGGTSAASAIIAGTVACLQGAHKGAEGAYLTPAEVRELLSADAMGAPQSGDVALKIGPRPDLYRILARKGIVPGLLIRDSLEDDGSAQPVVKGSVSPILWNRSPDLILGDADDYFLVDVPLTREIPSTRVGPGNVLYVRVSNPGRGPDDGGIRAWWSHPSSFQHPRWWRPMLDRRIPMIPPGTDIVEQSRWMWSRLDSPGDHVALIGAVQPRRNLDPVELAQDWLAIPDPVPDLPALPAELEALAAMSTDTFLDLSNRSRCFAVRSVIWESVRRGATVSFRYHLRGIPEGAADFRITLGHDLPGGTWIGIEPDGPIASTSLPALDWDVGNGYYGALPGPGSADFHLGANQEVVLSVKLTMDGSAPRGTYELTLDQWMSWRHLGRFTLVLRVS